MDLRGMNRYQTFGFRREWLEHFFEYGADCFTKGQLGGNCQYDALKVWLREAELLIPAGRGEQSGTATDLSEKLVPLGGAGGNPLVWAIIWTNLGYNSVIVRWYMKYAKHSNIYDSPELVFMLGDYYAATTRKKRHQLVIRDF